MIVKKVANSLAGQLQSSHKVNQVAGCPRLAAERIVLPLLIAVLLALPFVLARGVQSAATVGGVPF